MHEQTRYDLEFMGHLLGVEQTTEGNLSLTRRPGFRRYTDETLAAAVVERAVDPIANLRARDRIARLMAELPITATTVTLR